MSKSKANVNSKVLPKQKISTLNKIDLPINPQTQTIVDQSIDVSINTDAEIIDKSDNLYPKQTNTKTTALGDIDTTIATKTSTKLGEIDTTVVADNKDVLTSVYPEVTRDNTRLSINVYSDTVVTENKLKPENVNTDEVKTIDKPKDLNNVNI